MSAIEERVRAVVATVEDPEVAVALVDLGVVREVRVVGDRARVVLRPTRLACPGKKEMERRVRAAITSAAPELMMEVDWEMSRWQGRDVTTRGVGALLQLGYGDPTTSGPRSCPYCGSDDVRREGAFGGAVCKVPYSCRSCGSAFEELRGAVSETMLPSAGRP